MWKDPIPRKGPGMTDRRCWSTCRALVTNPVPTTLVAAGRHGQGITPKTAERGGDGGSAHAPGRRRGHPLMDDALRDCRRSSAGGTPKPLANFWEKWDGEANPHR